MSQGGMRRTPSARWSDGNSSFGIGARAVTSEASAPGRASYGSASSSATAHPQPSCSKTLTSLIWNLH